MRAHTLVRGNMKSMAEVQAVHTIAKVMKMTEKQFVRFACVTVINAVTDKLNAEAALQGGSDEQSTQENSNQSAGIISSEPTSETLDSGTQAIP